MTRSDLVRDSDVEAPGPWALSAAAVATRRDPAECRKDHPPSEKYGGINARVFVSACVCVCVGMLVCADGHSARLD